MKKVLFSSILGMASLCLGAIPAQARTFGLFTCGCWPCGGCCGKTCAKICVKPYNAFSPVASGSMCFDGCAPFCNTCPAGFPGMCPGGACPGYNPAMMNNQGMPACNGYPAPTAAPCGDDCAQAPAGGAIPPGYGYAPMYPPSVAPQAPQYNWSAGYGR